MNGKRVLIISHAGVNVAILRRALIKRLLAEGANVHIAVPRDKHADAVNALGAQVHFWNVARGSLNPVSAWRAIRHLRSITTSVRPDIAHSFTHQPNLFARYAVPPIAPLVNSVTGLGSNFLGTGLKGRLKRFIFQSIYHITARKAGAVIFQNNDDRHHFEHGDLLHGVPVFMVRGTGVDTTTIHPKAFSPEAVEEARAALGIDRDAVVFTLAARLLRDKGVYEFLDAAAGLRASHPSARFLLVGDIDPGNPSSLSEEELRRATEGGAVVAAGWRDDMPLVWALSDVAVLPSYREGLPVTMQEALASGLPVVVSDAPGCREVVIDGENGYKVPVRDAAALARAMAKLAEAPDMRRDMGKHSRIMAEAQFDANTLAGELIDVYRRVLKEQP